MIYGSITNCTVVGHGVRSEWECRLGYQIISEDTATNTREIKLQLEARTIHSKYTAVGNQLTPTIDGVPLNPIGMNFSTSNVNVWQVLGTRNIAIVGAFNGIKTGSFTTNLTGDWGLKSGSASVTINLANLHTPPVVTKVTMQEKNSLVNSYAGIVQFLSSKTITFTTTTYENATISSYQVYHNGVLIGSSTTNGMTIDFDKVGTLITFPMNNKTYCTLRFVVIDSYGTSGYLESQYEVIPYVKPNLVQTSSSVKRNGQLSGKVKLNLVGSFYNQKVNNVANTIKLEFTYYKKGETEPTTYYTIPFTLNGNSLNISNWSVAINNQEITDIDKNYAYNFKIRATDKFNKQSEITLLCPVGEYVWAEFKDRVDFKDITIKSQNPFLYSTKETRIGSLEDGTNIYRKIYEGTISSTDKEILQSNIINMDVLDFSKGKVNNQSGTQLGLGYNREGYGSQLYLYNNELTLAHTSDIVGKYRIILDYAKTRGYSIKGNSKQETTIGKNLARIDDTNISSTGYTLKSTKGLIQITTTGTANSFDLCNGTRIGAYLPTYANANDYKLTTANQGTYKISISSIDANITGTANQLVSIFTNQRQIQPYITKDGVFSGTTSFTLAANEYVKSIYLWTNETTTITKLNFKIQLENGSTATEWEKFTYGASPNPQYPQNIEVVENVSILGDNINLFNASTITENNFINAGDGVLGASSVSNVSDYIEIRANDTITISYDYDSLLNTGTRSIVFYDSNKKYISGTAYNSTTKIATYTSPNNAKYMRFSYDKNCYDIAVLEQQKVTIDLKGNCVSKIGDIQDYLLIHKNKYWLVKNVGKVVLNGSESWSLQSINSYGIANFLFNHKLNGINDKNAISSHFIQQQTAIANTKNECMYWQNNAVYIRMNKTTASTVEAFKQWLSTHNVTVYYQLAQPQLIDLGELPEEVEVSDDVQLISNLETSIEITDNFDFDTYKKY